MASSTREVPVVPPLFRAYIDYEDPYVQPLLLAAFKKHIPNLVCELVNEVSACDAADSSVPLLQWRSYETLDFDYALSHRRSLINAYIIRKSLIRKHFLSSTIHHYVTKHPSSVLSRHFASAVAFELDYAEFLDDALTEADAWDLTQSMERNALLEARERQYWILKPGMSDRGQGIRVFSTMAELSAIFEGWEEGDEDEEEDEAGIDSEEDIDRNGEHVSDGDDDDRSPPPQSISDALDDRITTSHLRHFLAQPYIDPPLLLPEAPYHNRKFHIRTYVVAAGALRVYVYSHMLALFASEAYAPPWVTASSRIKDGEDCEDDERREEEETLQRFRNVHLTNTCVQTSSTPTSSTAELDGTSSETNVFLLSELPLPPPLHATIQSQIAAVTAELFRAALAQPTNFQPLPQAFEVFGVDFLVQDRRQEVKQRGQDGEEGQAEGEEVSVQLLEVNAFPDFAQTGTELRDIVVKGLFEVVVREVVGPYFGDVPEARDGHDVDGNARLIRVLDLDQHLR